MSEENLVNEDTGSEAVSSEMEQTSTSGEFNYKDFLSEDLVEDPSLKDIKDVESLAKSYVSSQRMLGNSIRIPGEDAGEEARQEFYKKLESVPGVARLPQTDEEKDAFYQKLGRPESPDNYDVQLSEKVPDDFGAVPKFKQLAHELGLNNQQAQRMLEFYEESVVDPQLQHFDHQKEVGMQTLKEKWGSDYDARMNGAKVVVSNYAEKYPEAIKELVDGPTGNNPVFIEMLSDLAQGLSESDILQGQSKAQYGTTAEEALEQISEIRTNKAHPFHNDTDPDHRAAVQKVQKLYSIAYPGK